MNAQKQVTAYKAFNSDWTCRGFRYEVGKTYTHDGDVKVCESGFHSCENPFDVLNYYSLIDSKFAVVKAGGEVSKEGGDTKIASATITIEAELRLPEFIKSAVDWLIDACKSTVDSAASGDSSQLAASGNYSKLAASGDYSKLAASGDYSKLAASGDSSKLAASGDSSQLAASGNYSKLAASGNYSKLAASGDSSQLAASGNYSKLAASGDSSQLAASGDYSKLAASGDSSQLAASGDSSQLAASGNYSKLAASGDSSQLAASGDYSKLAASGDSSIAISSGVGSSAMAGKDGCIVLTRWVASEKRYRVSVGYVGENIKADVFYKLDDAGNFVEVAQ